MYPKTKSTLFSRHTLNLILAFGLVALLAGVYFLFKPFPAGPSLDVKANVREAASVAGWSAFANPRTIVDISALRQPMHIKPVAVIEAASVAGWSAYANAPVVVKEAASVAGWSAYANPPTIVKSEDVQKPLNPKSPESLRRR
jgi:hypothetical protein